MESTKDLINSASLSLTDTEARILTAAKKLFAQHGFSAISGDRLCKEARVSKTSLYKYFGDMPGVLEAVVKSERALFDLSVEAEPTSEVAYWTAMYDYGVKVLNLLNRPLSLDLVRIIHEEARSSPDLAEMFFSNADARSQRHMSSLITFGQKAGYIKSTFEAHDLADHLMCMWQGMNFMRARLGLTKKPIEDPEVWAQKCILALFPEAHSILSHS